MILSNEDPLKLQQVLDMNLQESLQYLLYVVEKNKKQEEMYKKRKQIR